MAIARGPWGGAQVKGSLSSLVFQGGTHGQVVRARTVPVNPNTPKQVLIRSSMAVASAAWTNTLTAAERQAWSDYSTGTPLPDRFGELKVVGGRQMFLRTNVALLNIGGSMITTAPSTPGVATPISPTLTGDTTAGLEIASVDITVPTGAIVMGRIGLPVSQARNFYKAPFSQVVAILPATTFPLAVLAPAAVAIGQRYFMAFRTFHADGKVSEEVIKRIDILT